MMNYMMNTSRFKILYLKTAIILYLKTAIENSF